VNADDKRDLAIGGGFLAAVFAGAGIYFLTRKKRVSTASAPVIALAQVGNQQPGWFAVNISNLPAGTVWLAEYLVNSGVYTFNMWIQIGGTISELGQLGLGSVHGAEFRLPAGHTYQVAFAASPTQNLSSLDHVSNVITVSV